MSTRSAATAGVSISRSSSTSGGPYRLLTIAFIESSSVAYVVSSRDRRYAYAVNMSSRQPLSRDRILRQALDLADESGVDALTMRKLGDALGFEAMSLYRHVANKDDMLGGMLDLVLAEWELPAAVVEWDEAIRDSAVSVHTALRRHKWAARLLMSAPGARPGRVQYMDALLRRLRESGFDP